jgi:hypothetical protein
MEKRKIKTKLDGHEFKKKLISDIDKMIGIKNVNEMNMIISLYNNIDVDKFKDVPVDILYNSVISSIADVIIDERRKMKSIFRERDNTNSNEETIKDMFKREMGTAQDDAQVDKAAVKLIGMAKNEEVVKVIEEAEINDFLGIADMKTLKLLLNPSSMYYENYVILDTDYRDISVDTLTQVRTFKWKYSNTHIHTVGFFNTNKPLVNIIAVKIMQPRITGFNIPPDGEYPLNTLSDKIQLQIEELSSQGYVSSTGNRYHFSFNGFFHETLNYLDLIGLTENEYEYKFNSPISHIDSITINMHRSSDGTIIPFNKPINRFIFCFMFTCINGDSGMI